MQENRLWTQKICEGNIKVEVYYIKYLVMCSGVLISANRSPALQIARSSPHSHNSLYAHQVVSTTAHSPVHPLNKENFIHDIKIR